MNPYADTFDRLRRQASVFAESTAAERLDRIHAIYDAIYEHRQEVGEAGVAELGLDGRAPIVPMKAMLADWDANLADWMEPTESAPGPALPGRRGYIRWEPKGVVLHLATWNTPVLASLSPVMSMISAGNTVVLKPSEIAPRSAAVIRKIIETAGQNDVVEVVEGGPEVGAALLELPFNHITYVGSNRVGRIIMEAAAKHFAGVTLEMGGKNPVVVAPDADVDDTAKRIVNGRMILAGQACLCPDYVLAHESNHDQLVDALRDTVTAFYDPDGVGFSESSAIGRIVNEEHTRRIGALIDDAVEKGAKVVIGGEVDVEQRFVSPTVLVGVTEDMEIFQEEVFGPVLTVHRYAERVDAIAEIEKRPKPLGCYVFTQDRETADWFINHTRAGSSAVNGIATQALVPNLPFGGVNHSGIGQLNGEFAFREFSNARGVVEDALAPEDRTPVFFPPFPEGLDMGPILDDMIAPESRS